MSASMRNVPNSGALATGAAGASEAGVAVVFRGVRGATVFSGVDADALALGLDVFDSRAVDVDVDGWTSPLFIFLINT